MKRGCIFDLDGTLVNSLEDLGLSVNQVMKNHGFPIHEMDVYNYFVGNGVKKLVERSLPQDHLDMLDQCLEEFHSIYENHFLDHTQPYEGITELVSALYQKGIKLAVVTNKPHLIANKIVETLFPHMFTIILGQQDSYPIKPHPQSTQIALQKMGLTQQECFFVGDSDVDILTGQNAHIDTIGVCWGFRGREELQNQGATYVVDKAMEIKEIIDENSDK